MAGRDRQMLVRFLARALFTLLPLITGCLAVPTGEYPETKPDIRKVVGSASSQKPVRPGVSGADVMELLGEPQFQSKDRSLLVYRRVMSSGYGIVPPPAYPAAG